MGVCRGAALTYCEGTLTKIALVTFFHRLLLPKNCLQQ